MAKNAPLNEFEKELQGQASTVDEILEGTSSTGGFDEKGEIVWPRASALSNEFTFESAKATLEKASDPTAKDALKINDPQLTKAREWLDVYFREIQMTTGPKMPDSNYIVVDHDKEGRQIKTRVQAVDEVEAMAKANDAHKWERGPRGRRVIKVA